MTAMDSLVAGNDFASVSQQTAKWQSYFFCSTETNKRITHATYVEYLLTGEKLARKTIKRQRRIERAPETAALLCFYLLLAALRKRRPRYNAFLVDCSQAEAYSVRL